MPLHNLSLILYIEYGDYCNSLPNVNMLDLSKLKAFADDKLKIIKMMISLFDRVENTLGKGETASYQHSLLFPQCFPKPSSLRS